jgi:diacylglycerol kinase
VWRRKFANAFRGLSYAIRTQNSFLVHLPVAGAVLVLAAGLQIQLWGWTVLLLCITIVITAELFNTSLEILVRRLHPNRHDEIGRALDVAAAAVLTAAIGAAVVGACVLIDGLLAAL